MSESANVSSLDALRNFLSAVLQFQSEARKALAAFETQLNRVLFWLERERPEFWKREIENCMREQSDARVRLHQCRMRRVGDFRPSCIEEVKALEKARRDLDFAQKQVPVVRQWRISAHHEANEFHGRSSQLVQLIERELPALVGLLQKSIERIETYSDVTTKGRVRGRSGVSRLADALSRELDQESSDADAQSTEDGTANTTPEASPGDTASASAASDMDASQKQE